jgi:hypothetical protein
VSEDETEMRRLDGAAPLSADERREYERRCLEQVRTYLERIASAPQEPHELITAELEGSHPDTRIRVVVFDRRYDRERTRSWELWRSADTGSPVFLGARQAREDPETVGLLISTWALGG